MGGMISQQRRGIIHYHIVGVRACVHVHVYVTSWSSVCVCVCAYV